MIGYKCLHPVAFLYLHMLVYLHIVTNYRYLSSYMKYQASLGWREKTNKMQLIWCLLSNFYLDMFWASLCPSSGEQDRLLPHMVLCAGCVELGCKLCDSAHSLQPSSPHYHSQHKQCRTPYAVIHGLVLLMMGITVPETCWDRSLIINISLVASCWFLFLHPTFMMHGHKSLKFKKSSLLVCCGRIGSCLAYLTGKKNSEIPIINVSKFGFIQYQKYSDYTIYAA